ncbi:MAG: hypothetical protein QNK37_19860 [Acidobacteriota bacterium]|nr:hypothetical protein [Acidobacteriota bacterium]
MLVLVKIDLIFAANLMSLAFLLIRAGAARKNVPATVDRIEETEGSPDDPDGNGKRGTDQSQHIEETEGSADDPDGNGGN